MGRINAHLVSENSKQIIMEAEIIETKPEPKFEPVTLQLTFETQEELNAMYAVVYRDRHVIWEEAMNTDIRNNMANQDQDSSAWRTVATSIHGKIESKVK